MSRERVDITSYYADCLREHRGGMRSERRTSWTAEVTRLLSIRSSFLKYADVPLSSVRWLDRGGRCDVILKNESIILRPRSPLVTMPPPPRTHRGTGASFFETGERDEDPPPNRSIDRSSSDTTTASCLRREPVARKSTDGGSDDTPCSS